MDWEHIQGHWEKLTPKVQDRWIKLTQYDAETVAGQRDRLMGKLQERYGMAPKEADKQIAEWQTKARDHWFAPAALNR
jgi:uncharacterized protein YjbJ (UPF0337 family)